MQSVAHCELTGDPPTDGCLAYGRALDSLADVYRILLVVDMKGEKGIGNSTVDHKLDLLLSRDGGRVAQVGAPPSGGSRAQALGGSRVVQLEAVAKRVELAGRVLNCRVVRRPSLRAIEAQIA